MKAAGILMGSSASAGSIACDGLRTDIKGNRPRADCCPEVAIADEFMQLAAMRSGCRVLRLRACRESEKPGREEQYRSKDQVGYVAELGVCPLVHFSLHLESV
jgi:hypothetical protein